MRVKGRRRLALAQRRRVDTDDDDVVAVGLVLECVEEAERELALEEAVREQVLVRQAEGVVEELAHLSGECCHT